VTWRGIIGVAVLALALAAASCGTEDPPTPGAPAPPEADAQTDCEDLEGEPGSPPLERDADGNLPYGFNDHAGLVGSIPVGEDAELQQEAGSTIWRVAIDWRFAEPEPGEIELDTIDAIYCEGLARGIRPIFHLTGAPEWAADPGGCPLVSCLYPPRDTALDELREFAALVAERYPRAAAIEAWNEPNLAIYWAAPDPERYVEVLTAIDDGVKSTGSGIPVLGGSLSNTSRGDETRSDFGPFLRQMLAAGAADHMDGVSFHPYPIQPLGERGERFRETMARLRRALAAGGAEGEAIWVTEVGLPVGGRITPEDQARTMDGIYAGLSSQPDVVAVVFHTLLEGESLHGAGDGFGWVVPTDQGIDPRPAFERFSTMDR
jgi:hypothetical protein